MSSLQVERVVAPVREQLVENLRTAIVEQQFKPGERLIERKLCELTGASRTSVREALRHLESEGFVTTTLKGPAVATMSATTARDLYQVRATLEALAAELFAERATDEEIAMLRVAVEAIAASESSGPRVMLAAKQRFYDVLFAGAGNPVIQQMVQLIQGRVSVLRATSLGQPGRPGETVLEMFAILEAIERRDPKGAAETCRAHVEHAALVARAALSSTGETRPK